MRNTPFPSRSNWRTRVEKRQPFVQLLFSFFSAVFRPCLQSRQLTWQPWLVPGLSDAKLISPVICPIVHEVVKSTRCGRRRTLLGRRKRDERPGDRD
jgi:hypothetical protein